jgi:hypothetical protein
MLVLNLAISVEKFLTRRNSEQINTDRAIPLLCARELLKDSTALLPGE